MKVSIVMSTYNGEQYLIEQLDSIRLQTVSPDQVIICDDKSTDNTPKIINEYINKYSLKNWFLCVNERNLGWKKNFIKLIDESDADLIFLSDQDDIWNKRKLEIMIPIMKNENINVLVSDYEQKTKNLDIDYKCKKKFNIKAIVFDSKFMWINYPGCSYCIRKSYFNKIKKWWRDYLPHDAFLLRNAKLDGSLYHINCNLIQHRMHGKNAGTPTKITQQKDDLSYYFDVLNLLLMRAKEENLSDKEYNLLNKSNKWLEMRKKLYNTKSMADFVRLSKFINFYPHIKTYIKEIIIARAK